MNGVCWHNLAANIYLVDRDVRAGRGSTVVKNE